jgi:hypothetical protein
MRKLTFAFVIAGTAILAANELNAQKASINFLTEAVITSVTDEAIDDAGAVNTGYISSDEVNAKAVHNFEKRFKAASNVKWMSLTDGYMASYKSNDVSNRVYFYKNGSFAGTLKGYQPGNLSAQMKFTVNDLYNGYSVVYVNEASVPGFQSEPTFIFSLKKNDELKVVRICGDETDVVFDSNKAESPKRF